MAIVVRAKHHGRRAGYQNRGVEAPNGGVFNARGVGGGTIKLWLDANSKNITFNATDVSQWNDISGNGNHVSQAVGANQPLWVASRQNLKPCVEFTAANGDSLVRAATNLVGAGPVTVFGAWKARNVPNQGGYFCNDVAARTSGWSLGTLGSGTGTGRNLNCDGIASHEFGAEDTTFRIWCIRAVSGVSLDCQLNGTDTSIANVPGTFLDPGGTAVLAVGSGPTAANFTDLDCYEVIVYGASLSNSDRALVTSYLRGKYAV